VHAAGLTGESLERTGDRDRGDDLAAGGADRGGHGGDTLLAFANGLCPAATSDARESGRGEGGVLDPERMHRGLQNAAFSAAALSGIRRRGWAQSVGEREQGVASVSAPVRSPSGKIIAAVSVSGPLERLSRQPGRMHAPAVLAAAERLSESLRRAAAADSA